MRKDVKSRRKDVKSRRKDVKRRVIPLPGGVPGGLFLFLEVSQEAYAQENICSRRCPREHMLKEVSQVVYPRWYPSCCIP